MDRQLEQTEMAVHATGMYVAASPTTRLVRDAGSLGTVIRRRDGEHDDRHHVGGEEPCVNRSLRRQREIDRIPSQWAPPDCPDTSPKRPTSEVNISSVRVANASRAR